MATMNEPVVIRAVVRLLVPFILMYALYVQFHGEISPGGGFQAGVIGAAAFIVYALVYGLDRAERILSQGVVRVGSAMGALIYGTVGVVALIKGGPFLNYSTLLGDAVKGQELGIFSIEIGVGVTVFSVMMVIFYTFAERTR